MVRALSIGLIGIALSAVSALPAFAQSGELPSVQSPAGRDRTGAITLQPRAPEAPGAQDGRFPLPPRAGGIPTRPGSPGVPPNVPTVAPPQANAPAPAPIGPRSPQPPRAPQVTSPTVNAPTVNAPRVIAPNVPDVKVTPPADARSVEPARQFPVPPRAAATGEPQQQLHRPQLRPDPPGYRPPLTSNRPGVQSPPPGRMFQQGRSGAQNAPQATPPGFFPIPRANRPQPPGPTARPNSPLAATPPRRGATPPTSIGRCTPQMLSQGLC